MALSTYILPPLAYIGTGLEFIQKCPETWKQIGCLKNILSLCVLFLCN